MARNPSFVFRTCGQRIQIALSLPKITNMEPSNQRSIKPSNQRTIEPANHRSIEPSNQRTTEPPVHRTIEPTIHRTSKPLIHRTFKPESNVASDMNVQNTVRSDVTGDLVYSAPAHWHSTRKLSQNTQRGRSDEFYLLRP